MTLFIDFESYSAVDIKTRGGYQYCIDDSTQVICLGWAFDQEEPQLWTPASGPLPKRIIDHVTENGKVAAFNAQFDMRIWNWVGVRDFGWPRLTLSQIVDVQALCACYQIPQSLATAGEALRIPMPKDKAGTNLVKACCTPNKNGEQPFPSGQMSATFQALFRYCLRDVKAMQQIAYLLPRQELIPQEQAIWELTAEMNLEGLPIDYESVTNIYSYLQEYIERTVVELPKLTGGVVTTPGQIARILKWCASKGFIIPNLQADTVDVTLCRPSIPADVRRVLELRQELGKSSTAKYKKILDQCYTGRVFDNLRYHGAGTGRWTGMGFQMHNLPRASVEDPQEWIDKFNANQPIDDPVGTAKALIRPIVQAPKGYQIIVADYSSIENRLLAWAAGDTQTLADFDAGLDQYKVMAAARFGVPYAEVTKEQRRVGKVIILGCGYQMGAKKFRETALVQAQLELTEEEAKASVDAYRERYPLVKALWGNLARTAMETVVSGQKRQYKNTTFGIFTRNGIKWLGMQLPTGKALYYMQPEVKEEPIKDYEHMGPVPTITHWGTNPYTKKWSRLKLIPGRLTENLIQASAREVMARGLLNVKQWMPEVTLIGSVHDEALGLVPERHVNDTTLRMFMEYLCKVDFLPGCNITAEGFFTPRYRKG
jgi:DNA polymerase